jgi:prepilin-type N-terminal cleavage/methylation domain-containing protein
MKHQKTSWFKRWFLERRRSRNHRYRGSAGFTLIELIVATVITTVVILIVGTGFISALNGSKMAEARTARRVELNRAFDFITNEIRQAESINRTANRVVSATTTVADIVIQSGLSLSSLGSYGTPALYMEIPIGAAAPAQCPAGGPNAGLAPPSPTTYDRVVYDIRASSQGWLGPRVIGRYGRIPKSDGSIDPCSNPIGSDVLIDAISPTMSASPVCPAPSVLSGAEGFYTCVNGAQVDLFFQSNVVGAEIRKLVSAASSRIVNLNLPQLTLENVPPQVGDAVNLRWSWPDATSNTIYDLYQVVGTSTTKLYSGSTLSTSATLTGSKGENNCFVLKTSIPPATVAESNQVCFLKP